MTYLGIDIGTSGRQGAADRPRRQAARRGDGASRSSRSARIPAGRSRTRPTGGARRSRRSTSSSKSHPSELAAVRGIGLSGHMHGATLLDKNDEVLRPAILWNDGRSAAECAEMEAALPAPARDRRQYRHARLHRAQARLGPEARAARSSTRIAKVLLPKAYVRLLLTGEHVEDMSDAAGTLWLDVGEARLVRRTARASPASTARTCRASSRARRPRAMLKREFARALGHERRRGRRRRRRRQRRRRLRHRRHPAGRGLRVARHLGRAVRLQRPLPPQHRGRGARLLPRHARTPGTRWA